MMLQNIYQGLIKPVKLGNEDMTRLLLMMLIL